MKPLLLILLLSLYASANSYPLELVIKVFNKIEKLTNLNAINYENTLRTINEINNEMNELLNTNIFNTSSKILNQLPDNIRLEMKLNDLLDYIRRIDEKYKSMQQYLQQNQKVVLEDFARSTISQLPDSVLNIMERVNVYLVPNGIGLSNAGLLHVVKKEMDSLDMICNLYATPQHIILELYQAILLTVLRGYTMMQYSYTILNAFNRGNFKMESTITEETYKEAILESIKVLADALKSTSRKYWKCDPPKFIKDENYLEITQLLQGYIVNEIDLNQNHNCMHNCAYYTNTTNYGCYDKDFCQDQRSCNGRILDCKYTSGHYTACKHPSSNKRYQEVVEERKHKNKSCMIANSWWYIFWHCSYCTCICDEQLPESDKYFSLQEVKSDIENNMVITGLKLVKINQIIHIQIQQGKLLPDGIIDQNTLSWLQVDGLNVSGDPKMYHTLTANNRGIDLDELEGTAREILTGVRFSSFKGRLCLQIHITAVDFPSGQLNIGKSNWVHNRIRYGTKLDVESRKDPTLTDDPSTPDSHAGDYIEFTHTSFEYDFAQTTVPFLDSQEVVLANAVPLSGAGIYHKGSENYSGFIGLNIFSHDVLGFLHKDIVTEDEVQVW